MDNDEIAWVPGLVHAFGTDTELVVFRSAVVLDTDRAMRPVIEHINSHRFVLADQSFIEDDSMVTGLARVERYTTAAARRDGCTEPGVLASMIGAVDSGQTYRDWSASRG